jgi:phosphoglycerate dehydrogenase-like enzyme
MPRILLGWQATEGEVDLVGQELPEGCDVVTVPPHETVSPADCDIGLLADCARDADCLMTWIIGPRVYKLANRLKLIAWLHSGIDPIDLETLRARQIRLTNVAGANATAVAEHAAALMLALAKRVVERDARVKRGEWVPLWNEPTAAALLDGGTLLVVGMGQIGKRIARYARAFGMRVIGVRRSGRPEDGFDATYGPADLTEAIAQADFVILAVPHTAETDKLISRDEFAAMKKGAFLINVGRGRIVDEIALRKALDSRHVAGFASDVWWSYPRNLPEGWHYAVPSRLGVHLMPQVIASHDSASDATPVKRSMIRLGAINVKAFLAGERPPNLVFDGTKLVGSLAGLDRQPVDF